MEKSITAYSKNLDLALLKVDGKYKPLTVRKTLYDKVGAKVIAIGNPQGRFTGSVTDGIISAIRKDNNFTLIQTDAAISPGSSGGPLFNEQGEVIGITTMIWIGKHSQNLNFAVPSHLIFELKKQGKNWEPTVPNTITKPIKRNPGIKLIEPRVDSTLFSRFSYSISNK